MSEEFERTLKRDFLVESIDMVSECESAFLQLEKDPQNTQLIDKIFRLAHTIKGSGLAVGFADLAKFAHAIEHLLSKVRLGEQTIDTEVVDILLESMDALKFYVSMLQDDFGAKHDTEDIESRIYAKTEFSQTHSSASNQTQALSLVSSDAIDRPALPTLEFSSSQIRILICDDEVDILDTLTDALAPIEATIFKTTSALEGLNICRSSSIDVVMTDLRMPGMNGLEFAQQLRKIDPHLPIVFCSGHTDRRDLMSMLKLGVYDFIEKPFRFDDVLWAVKRGIKAKRVHAAIDDILKLNFKVCSSALKLLAKHVPANAESQKTLDSMDALLREIGERVNYLAEIR